MAWLGKRFGTCSRWQQAAFVGRWLLCALVLSASGVAAAQASEPEVAPSGGQWFIGGYYRHNWIAPYILDPFFTSSPSISNDGFGLTVSHRSQSGFTIQLGFGHMPYAFKGAFRADQTTIEDTEYVTSDLALEHLTGSILWPIQLHRMLTFELGVGADLGVFTGDIVRSEAYPDFKGRFHACEAAHKPALTGPDKDVNGELVEYCAQAYNSNDQPIASNSARASGEQYAKKEPRVPPLMLFPMLPHLALRFAPIDQLAVKLEFAFGLAQFWAGFSVHVGLGRSAAPKVPAPVPVAEVAVTGRVLGTLVVRGTGVGIAHASIKADALSSAIETDEQGGFVVDRLAVGSAHFEISHPDYEPGTCDVQIAANGGDVKQQCFLDPKPTTGGISGQVQDEQGAPVGGARVEITGPSSALAVTGAGGAFQLSDAQAGTYRVRVDADGFLIQLVEIEVGARATAQPRILLIKKPTVAAVTRKDSEIVIHHEINFASGSAEIAHTSDDLLLEVVDMLLRNRDVQLIEIQGHTDNKGGRDHNQALSQARAESVLAWLVRAGVDSSRLTARGYGQTVPLRPNDTEKNRAKNRRVQFIILRQ